MAIEAVVDGVLRGLGAPFRCVAPGEWGLSLPDVGGWPLEVGLAVREDLLRVQAEAVRPAALDPEWLLHRNRLRPVVRYAHSSAGAVHVQAELPTGAVDAVWLDRVLALLVEAAEDARQAARRMA